MGSAAAGDRFLPACGGVLRRMWRVFRGRWRTLLLAGLILFVPLGLLETIDLSVREAVEERGGDSFLDVLEVVGIGALHAVGSVVGEVIFAGVVTAVFMVEHGHHRSLRELLAELSLGRLALADLALVLIVILGLLAFIVPGFIFLIWFALVGPVIEVEHVGVRQAFRRSREVVRSRFWLVAAFVIPLSLLDETLTNLAHEAAIAVFGETFAGEWAAGTLTELFTSLPLALAAVVLYFELSDARRPSPRTRPPDVPPIASRSFSLKRSVRRSGGKRCLGASPACPGCARRSAASPSTSRACRAGSAP